MADTPVPTPQRADDPFDLGDTGLSFTPPVDLVTKPTPLKGPDGKFISPATVEPTTPQSKHPATLLRQARDFGLEDETIEGMSTPALYRTMNLFLTREREIAHSFQKQATLEGARVPQPVPQPIAPVEPEADPLDALLADGLDPRVVAALKAGKSSSDEIKSLKAALAQRDQRDEMREISSGSEIIDFCFTKLADPRFGEGSAVLLRADPAKQAEFQRRVAVLNAAGITDLRKVNRLTIMKQLREASEALFGRATADPYTAALNGTQPANGVKPRISEQEWNNGGVARPTQRNGSPELKGEALAVKNLTEKMREQDAQRTDESELDGIPD